LLVNGRSAGDIQIPADQEVREPVRLEISRFLQPGKSNNVTFAGLGTRGVQAQLNTSWYEPWPAKPPTSAELGFDARFSTLTPAIHQQVTCDLLVTRRSWRGNGMMIAEVGLPPGAEVDRGTLAALVGNSQFGVDAFEAAPDRVTFYLWPRAAGSRFRFLFRPRYAMKARAVRSVLYEYYNPDERLELAPPLFTVAPAGF
ncbi:MAG: hypothetical protein NTY38_24920, partial [Acidobacteria bacterium]|nr:hypothetical protein [Acidobacteriota bacterium]